MIDPETMTNDELLAARERFETEADEHERLAYSAKSTQTLRRTSCDPEPIRSSRECGKQSPVATGWKEAHPNEGNNGNDIR